MSLQSDATKTVSDDWRVRSALKPKQHYSLADFPVGKLIVGEVGKPHGALAYLLVEIIDGYECKEPRWSSDGLILFGRIVASDTAKDDPLIGHITQLYIAAKGSWFARDAGCARVTTIPPKQLFASALAGLAA